MKKDWNFQYFQILKFYDIIFTILIILVWTNWHFLPTPHFSPYGFIVCFIKNLGRSILHSNSDTHSLFCKGKMSAPDVNFLLLMSPTPAISPSCTSCSPMSFVIRRPVYSISLFSSCFTLQVLHLNNYWSEADCIVGWLNGRNYLFYFIPLLFTLFPWESQWSFIWIYKNFCFLSRQIAAQNLAYFLSLHISANVHVVKNLFIYFVCLCD